MGATAVGFPPLCLLPFSFFFPAFLPPFAAGNTTSGGGGGLFPLPPSSSSSYDDLSGCFLPSSLASPSWPSASVTHKPTDRVCRERKEGEEAGRYGGMVGKGGRGGGGAGTQNTGGGPKFLPAVKSPFPSIPLPTMQ